VSLKRQETALESPLIKLPTTVSVCISVGVQGAQRRGVVCKQRAEQEGVGQACQAGTASRASSSSTQKELKASSTALGKEGIDRIEEGTSSSVRAREGSSSSLSDELGVGSSLGTGTTAGTGAY
jgi:hypothetical protein